MWNIFYCFASLFALLLRKWLTNWEGFNSINIFVFLEFLLKYFSNGIALLLPNIFLEAATGDVLWRGMFLGLSGNSWEGACSGVSFLIKLQTLGLWLYWKRDFGAGVFHESFPRFLRVPFLQSTSVKLLVSFTQTYWK